MAVPVIRTAPAQLWRSAFCGALIGHTGEPLVWTIKSAVFETLSDGV